MIKGGKRSPHCTWVKAPNPQCAMGDWLIWLIPVCPSSMFSAHIALLSDPPGHHILSCLRIVNSLYLECYFSYSLPSQFLFSL